MTIKDWKLGWIAFSLAMVLPVNTSAQNLIQAPLSGPPIIIDAQVSPQLRAEASKTVHGHLEGAINSATKRVAGWQTLVHTVDYRTALDTERDVEGSMSIGTVGHGFLQKAATLEFIGEHHEIIERHRRYGTAHATDEMVALLLGASAHVDQFSPGAPLRVGNMSRSKGGDIRWSRSHNSGRDADLAFYVRRIESGTSVKSPGIIKFDASGAPAGYPELEFDTRRNWLLVRGMLQHPVTIQYVFISLPLKAKLLEHAQRTGEPQAMIEQASKVLHQPTDALPHNDHFHLRIGCAKDDRVRGCVDRGPQWAWNDWHEAELLSQAVEFGRGLRVEKDVDTRLAILDFMKTIRSPYASEIALTVGVYDAAPQVRERAWQVARHTWPWTATTIIAAQELVASPETPLTDKIMAYSILRRSADPEAHAFALEQLAQTDAVPSRERVFAARALRHTTDASFVPQILTELERQPSAVCAELANALRRLTNHSSGIDWATASKSGRSKAIEDWKVWYAQHAELPREHWVLEGMQAAGLKITALEPEAVDALLEVLGTGDDFVVYNANRAMRELTGRWAPLEQSDGHKLHKYWAKWWAKNRARVLSKPKDS